MATPTWYTTNPDDVSDTCVLLSSAPPPTWRWATTTADAQGPPPAHAAPTTGTDAVAAAGRPTNAAKTWVFTVNNPCLSLLLTLARLACETITYLAVGLEVGASGTPHLQGCITFKKPWRFNRLREYFRNKAWISKAIAPNPARRYCMKDGCYLELDHRQQGQRNDQLELVGLLKEVNERKRKLTDLFHSEEYALICFQHSAKIARYLANLRAPVRTQWTKCLFIYGPGGTGKSTWLTHAWPDYESVNWDGNFLNGYSGESDVCVMDDANLELITDTLFKQLVNKTKQVINVKNQARTQWNAKLLIIISNLHPREYKFYEPNEAEITDQYGHTAVERRLHANYPGTEGAIVHWDTPFVVPDEMPEWAVGDGPASGSPLPEPE